MDGYATFTRIEHVRPRRVAVRERDASQVDPSPDHDAVDPDAPPLDIVLGERISRLREVWNQTTFYLFDADGWR